MNWYIITYYIDSCNALWAIYQLHREQAIVLGNLLNEAEVVDEDESAHEELAVHPVDNSSVSRNEISEILTKLKDYHHHSSIMY